jgi:hypothetical protein
MVEGFRDVLTEGITSSTRTDSPTTSIVRITPKKIAHRSLMGNFLDSIQRSDIIKCVNARGQSAMKAEDLIIDQCGEREIVEKVGKILPDVGIAVFS